MRNVRRVILLMTLVWLAPHVALADSIGVGDTVVLQQMYDNGNTGAGAFSATVNGDAATAFVTFCMQADVGTWADIGSNLYVAGITDFATWQSPDQGGDANGRNYLNSETAWLYMKFRQGALDGYNQSVTASDALQWAVWQLQDEKTIPVGETYSDLANSFIALADQAVANGFTGIGDVGVLNLVNADGSDAQDQLTLVPEPSSSELLMMSALGLFFVGRKRLAVGRARVIA